MDIGPVTVCVLILVLGEARNWRSPLGLLSIASSTRWKVVPVITSKTHFRVSNHDFFYRILYEIHDTGFWKEIADIKVSVFYLHLHDTFYITKKNIFTIHTHCSSLWRHLHSWRSKIKFPALVYACIPTSEKNYRTRYSNCNNLSEDPVTL